MLKQPVFAAVARHWLTLVQSVEQSPAQGAASPRQLYMLALHGSIWAGHVGQTPSPKGAGSSVRT